MDYEHTDFPSAVRKLAARAGITVVEKSRGRAADDEERQRELRQRLLKLHAEAAQWFHENLIKREVGDAARKYLGARGITVQIAKGWQLGYAPDEWNAFGSWARERGYELRDLIASGLIKTKDESDGPNALRAAHATASYDRFRGRIMFPICNDADTAGQKAAERSLDALLQNDLVVRVAEMPAGEDPDSLVRCEGKEAFEKRITGARDFFDYWLERETTGSDLGSLGAKMQVA